MILLLLLPPAVIAQEPLNEQDKREILVRLQELSLVRQKVALLEGYIKLDAQQDVRERELAAKQLELERQATSLAQKERDSWKDKADSYEHAFKVATAGRSKKCTLFKIVSLGIVRCH